MAVRTNTSKKGWDEVCQGIPTGGEWDLQDQQLHINVLQVKKVKLALLAYHRQFQMKPISYSSSVLSCEIGRYQEQFNGINKRNWKYLLHHGITTTAEYLHECSSGLAVKKHKRPLRVESPSTNISGFFRSKQDHKQIILLLDCQFNFNGILHENRIHTVRERMHCKKFCSVSIFMLSHLFQ